MQVGQATPATVTLTVTPTTTHVNRGVNATKANVLHGKVNKSGHEATIYSFPGLEIAVMLLNFVSAIDCILFTYLC